MVSKKIMLSVSLLLLLTTSIFCEWKDVTNGMFLDQPSYTASGENINSVTIDANNEKIGFIGQALKSGNVIGMGFRTGTVSTPGLADYSIQTVNPATGFPSGSYFCAGSSVGYVTGTSAVTTNITTMTPCYISQGSFYAIVAEKPAGSALVTNYGFLGGSTGDFSYTVSSISTSGYTKTSGTTAAGFYLIYDDNSIAASSTLGISIHGINQATYHTGNSPITRGNSYKLPFGVKFSRIGFDGQGPGVLEVWDYDAKTLMTYVYISSSVRSNTDLGSAVYVTSNTVTWYPNKTYYITLRATSSSAAAILVQAAYANNAQENQAFLGSNVKYVTLASYPPSGVSSFVSSTNARGRIFILPDKIDTGVPGGSWGSSQ